MQRIARSHIEANNSRAYGPVVAPPWIAGICAVALLLSTPPVHAQSEADGDPVQSQLDAMRRELDRIRTENQTMKGEIDELRAATDESWLTEARANEIRGLVADTLADADMRASLLQNGMPAGWSEHFFLSSLDGRFLLILEGQMQIRWVFNFHEQDDGWRQGFENTRTRLTFRGHIFDEDIEYLIRGEYGRAAPGTNTLLDAWVRHNLTDNWSVRFGQFKLPFNREELVSPFEQQAVERSLINEQLNVGRSQGIELTYHDDANRFAVAYSDGGSLGGAIGGLAGGSRTNTTALAEDTEYSFTGRYERLVAGTWDQFNDFTSPRGEEFGLLLGAGFHVQKGESTGLTIPIRNEPRVAMYSLDVSAEFGGANAFLAFTHGYIDTEAVEPPLGTGGFIFHVYGVVAQVGVYVAPKWEVFVRGEYGAFDLRNNESGVAVSDLNLVTAGVNYYIDGHDLKWTTDVGFGIYQVDGTWASDLAGWQADGDGVYPQVVLRTQFQLLF